MLGTLDALAEDQVQVPKTHTRHLTTACSFSSMGSNGLFWHMWMHTCMWYKDINSGTHAVLWPVPPYCKFNPQILEKGSLNSDDKQEVCRRSLWRQNRNSECS